MQRPRAPKLKRVPDLDRAPSCVCVMCRVSVRVRSCACACVRARACGPTRAHVCAHLVLYLGGVELFEGSDDGAVGHGAVEALAVTLSEHAVELDLFDA
eukprot:1562831-Pleurochrysis_carterae.AAC.1